LERAGWDNFELGHEQRFYGWNGFLWQFLPWASAGHVGLSLLLSALTVGLAALPWRDRIDIGSPRFYYASAAQVLATLLINPHVLSHDLALIVVALALAARAERRASGSFGTWRSLAIVCWFALLIGPLSGLNFVTPLLAALLLLTVSRAVRLRTSLGADNDSVLDASPNRIAA
jgi:hypothetical protein